MTKPFSPNRRHLLAMAARVGGLAAGMGVTSAKAGFLGDLLALLGGGKGGGGNCILRGTRISTGRGEMPIEEIVPGDLVRTARGLMEVRWVGRQTVDLSGGARGPVLQGTLPVRIRQHALDGCLPRADLLVSPGHALLVDGVLIPAVELVNGVSIAPIEPGSPAAAEYYHLLLDTHEVLFAEGAPVESLRIEGKHTFEMFANGADYLAAHAAPSGPMAPYAPIISYKGASHVVALLRRACSTVADVRDPAQIAYDRIAARCIERQAA